MSKTFIKKIEDFNCEHCGYAVVGNGYTNHCPKCLWSKHVDNSPGDRASKCGGMMAPVKIEMVKDEFVITNTCVVCGHSKRNKSSIDDDLSVILNKNKKQ
jgi:rubrerythrin